MVILSLPLFLSTYNIFNNTTKNIRHSYFFHLSGIFYLYCYVSVGYRDIVHKLKRFLK